MYTVHSRLSSNPKLFQTEPLPICKAENAGKILDWMRTRGGIAVWVSVDLSSPGECMITPYLNMEGNVKTKPHWRMDNTPERVITDPAMVVVSTDVEVKRFRIALRIGSQGMSIKVSDGGSRRIRKEVEKAGDGAYYVFDYATQEAVIMKPKGEYVPLDEWERKQKGSRDLR